MSPAPPTVDEPSLRRLPVGAPALRTARAALGLTAEDLASASACAVALVEQIESGGHDPVLDTVHRLLNNIGLELRCGIRPIGTVGYETVTPDEIRRLSAAWAEACAARAVLGLGPPLPLADLQLPWDGTPPAPPQMIGAGPSRGTGGGWAAMLVRRLRTRSRMSQAAIAEASHIDEAKFALIESGAFPPPVSDLERIFDAAGEALAVRVEVYDTHDDVLELQYRREQRRSIGAHPQSAVPRHASDRERSEGVGLTLGA